jgi:acetyl esterase/lipase
MATSGPRDVMTWEVFRELEPAPPGVAIPRWGGPGDGHGDGTPKMGELRLPDGHGPHPVAMIVHGGCWSSIAGPGYVSRLAEAVRDLGWATWSPAFLRADDRGGAWPGMMADAGRALDHLRAFGPEYELDLRRIVTIGHSSGGHLALWLAARAALPRSGDGSRLRGRDPLGVTAVVGLAPICGLLDFHTRTDRGCPDSAVSDLLGGDPEHVPERRGLADPETRVPLGVPQLLLTGALDETVPTAHVERYARMATEAGDTVQAVEIPAAGHFELVSPEHQSWRTRTGPAIRDFLSGVTAPK